MLRLVLVTLSLLIYHVQCVSGTCSADIQTGAVYSVVEGTHTFYVPFVCTYSTSSGRRQWLTETTGGGAAPFNLNYQRLGIVDASESFLTLPDGTTTSKTFAVVLKGDATLDYECEGCSSFQVTVNCGATGSAFGTDSFTVEVSDVLEAPFVKRGSLPVLYVPELSSDASSEIGALQCALNGHFSCETLQYYCRSGYLQSGWVTGADESLCGNGIRAFSMKTEEPWKMLIVSPELLSVRDIVRTRQFGGWPKKWHLIYSKGMPSSGNRQIVNKDWGALAARAQMRDEQTSPVWCILIKRVCPMCAENQKEVYYKRYPTPASRGFNNAWWEYCQMSDSETGMSISSAIFRRLCII